MLRRNGLSTAESERRLEKYGHNKLESSGGVKWYQILVRQVANSLTVVLVIAMSASWITLDFIEGGVIAAVILLNIVVGFWQDYRAEQDIQSLLAMAAPTCEVLRDNGTLGTIKADLLVPGDLVQLGNGDIVPADLRLVAGINFATDEAALTGESKPRAKSATAISADVNDPIGDRANMVYSSTTVSRGRATGVVVATGMDTEIGQIAKLLADKSQHESRNRGLVQRWASKFVNAVKSGLGLEGTPLQVKLSKFALLLFALAILLAIIVFSANSWDINDEVIIYGICVAVAVIPESLIAVLTITIANGSKAMAKGNVIVRQMQSLEAIGGVTNICSDKTGTLTQGKMLARRAFMPSGMALSVDEEKSPFDPTSGTLKVQGKPVGQEEVLANKELSLFFKTISLCNISTVNPPKPEEKDSQWSGNGEPTEIALHVLAMRAGHGKQDVLSRERMSIVAEHSFDSALKRMSCIYRNDEAEGRLFSFTKGATEVLSPLLDIPQSQKEKILAQVDAMSSEGLRVLCLAHRSLDASDIDAVQDRAFVEQKLNFAGLVGIYDPPRMETAGAIRQCQAAGITVHMLTGDHLKTATTIAKEIGIIGPQVPHSQSDSAFMTAQVFDGLSDREIDQMETLPFVLARCAPATKQRMLDALHRRGKYCVMTGDGVNDAPALKRADVGVAMGLNGSDVSKDAADMVLTDDNFASIVSAVREGRRLFDNIQKFLLHLLISNISQVLLLLIGLAFQDRHGVSVFPLSPIEILWANLITSSFLALGLGLEEASSDVLTRPPKSLKAGVFTKELIVDKFIYGTFMGVLCLASYAIVAFGVGDGDLGMDCNEAYNETCDLAYRSRGTAYSILTVLLSIMALEAKHLTRGLFNMNPEEKQGPFSIFHTITKNRFLFWAVLVGVLTPFPIIYIPGFNRRVFRHGPLTYEWGLVFASVVLFVALVESWKAIKRRKLKFARPKDGEFMEKSESSSIA